ncbi:MAG: copper chaperone [Turicibacter sanguinis]
MVKTFMINVENLKTDEDVKKIESYFETNLDGVEKLDINLSLKLVSVRYNDSTVRQNIF